MFHERCSPGAKVSLDSVNPNAYFTLDFLFVNIPHCYSNTLQLRNYFVVDFLPQDPKGKFWRRKTIDCLKQIHTQHPQAKEMYECISGKMYCWKEMTITKLLFSVQYQEKFTIFSGWFGQGNGLL